MKKECDSGGRARSFGRVLVLPAAAVLSAAARVPTASWPRRACPCRAHHVPSDLRPRRDGSHGDPRRPARDVRCRRGPRRHRRLGGRRSAGRGHGPAGFAEDGRRAPREEAPPRRRDAARVLRRVDPHRHERAHDHHQRSRRLREGRRRRRVRPRGRRFRRASRAGAHRRHRRDRDVRRALDPHRDRAAEQRCVVPSRARGRAWRRHRPDARIVSKR